MKRILIMTIIVMVFLLLVTACGLIEGEQKEGGAMPTRATVAEVDMPTTLPETSETTEPDLAIIVEETETGERKPLPNLATAPVDSGLGGNITIAEAETSMLVPETLFNNATFSLNTTLPIDATEAQVWQQSPVPLDESRAKAIAQRWGFTGPLYQYAILDESAVGDPIGLEAAQLPADILEFHAFDGAKSLMITEEFAYFSDNSVPFDYEIPRPFAQHAPDAEAVLQLMGLLDFPYTLADGWGHEVWVNRELDGMGTDYPEISAGVSENGRLAFASYQPFDHLVSVGTYPLISAESAWQQIQDGIDEDTLFSITPSIVEDENSPNLLNSGFQYWPRKYQMGQEVHLYTFPTVFLPVDETLPPQIHALNYRVQTDDDTRRALAEYLGKNVHFWGVLDTSTNSLALTGWEPLSELNPLIKNGTIQRQGEQTLLLDQSGGTFILPNAPADLPTDRGVNVFSWAERDAGQIYPVLDWEGIDLQIADSSGEMMAMPEILPPVSPVYEQISINEAELAYYVYPEMIMGENGRYQQSYWLLPVWQFTGLANNGDTLTFTVQATE